MAEDKDGTEKSEEPSEKKLRESREKGEVPRSIELTTLMMMLVSSVFLYFFGYYMMEDFSIILEQGLSFDRAHAFDTTMMADRIFSITVHALYMMLPLLILMTVVAVVSPALIGGWSFSMQAVAPAFSKINPATGMARMVSAHALMELIKALAKFVLIGAVAAYFLWINYEEILSLGVETKTVALAHAALLISKAFIFFSLALILIALIDVPFQIYEHTSKLKMTVQEVREEFKQEEGDPEVKARIRNIQREMSQKRMMQSVPDADVVITNPTHFAIALKYDINKMAEPMVLALGIDFTATQIRTVAKEHNIPIIESPMLARALYYNSEIDQPIPYELFKAVAAILAYVYQIRDGANIATEDFKDLSIPEQMKTEQN